VNSKHRKKENNIYAVRPDETLNGLKARFRKKSQKGATFLIGIESDNLLLVANGVY
jgi:hypothetical protein